MTVEANAKETSKPPQAATWKHEGRTLGLRCLTSDYTSYGGFANPREAGAEVMAPDWSRDAKCGRGIHWTPWGIGHDGQEHGADRPIWCVVEPIGDIVAIEGKAKSPGVRVVRFGSLAECMLHTHAGRMAFIQAQADHQRKAATGDSSSAAATGDSSSAAATGDSSSAAATGYRSSAAATGDSSSAAATGYRSSAAATGYSSSAAATGDSSSAAATGYSSSAAATGDSSSAAATGDATSATSTGLAATAKAGPWGAIVLAWWNESERRRELRAAEIGCGDGSDGKLKANVAYQLDADGRFVEASP